jgi:hypothetical protein
MNHKTVNNWSHVKSVQQGLTWSKAINMMLMTFLVMDSKSTRGHVDIVSRSTSSDTELTRLDDGRTTLHVGRVGGAMRRVRSVRRVRLLRLLIRHD